MPRRPRTHGFQSNPFVVLSDITIALAIIFLVFAIATGVANTQILMFFDRNERQTKIENDIVHALRSAFPNSSARFVRAPRESRDHVEIKEGDKLVAAVWTNASFQRIQILKAMFQPRSPSLTSVGKNVISQLSPVIQRHAAEFSYLFLHGVTEKAESSSMTQAGSLTLSQGRAQLVLDTLKAPSAPKVLGIPAQYVIPFGTGSELYTVEGAQSGRVDFLMFYNDITGSSKDGQGRSSN